MGHLPDEVGGYLTGPAPDPAGSADPASDLAGSAGPAPDLAGMGGPGLGSGAGMDGLEAELGLDGGGAAVSPAPAAGPAEFLRRVGQRAGWTPPPPGPAPEPSSRPCARR
ncbi:hypothetical protein NKG94_13845 [Micromonospora sp. M12]